MYDYLTQTNLEKIADILDNRRTGYERPLAYLYIKALRNNDRETIIDFEQYGAHPGQIFSNHYTAMKQRVFGINVLVFGEHGWAENMKWKRKYEIIFLIDKKTKRPSNQIVVAESFNGLFAYGLNADNKDGGHHYSPSIYGDYFKTEAEAITAACNDILDWHKTNNTELISQMEKAVAIYLTPIKTEIKQLELFA